MLRKISRLGIILMGSLVTLAIIFPNGFWQCFEGVCGIVINKKYFHDSLWHIALGRAAFGDGAALNPAMSGKLLVGYNFLLDYLIHLVAKIGVSPLHSFFHLFPLFFVVTYPFLILRYCRQFQLSATATTLTLFFAYFGSSFGFIFSLLHTQSLVDSALWQFPSAQTLQSPTLLYNLQFGFSLLFIIWALPLLRESKYRLKQLILMFVITALATGFKFYAGITLVLLFGLKLFLNTLKFRRVELEKVWIVFATLFGFLVALSLFYSPQKAATSSVFAFAPFSFSQKMIEELSSTHFFDNFF